MISRCVLLIAGLFFCAPFAFTQVVINEVLYRTNSTASDPLKTTQWAELYNKGDAAVDLTGWTLTGNGGLGSSSARALPAVSLSSHAYLVVHFTAGNTTATAYYTQDTAGIWNPDSDEAALFSPTGIVDFISWYDRDRAYQPRAAHDAAVAAKIWTAGAALNSDGVAAAVWERPRVVEAGMSIGRDPDSTDTDKTVNFEPHGGVGALNNSPGRRNLDSIQIEEVNPLAAPAAAGGLRPETTAPPKKKWTVLLYFDADNSLERYIYGNVQELAFGGSALTDTEKPGSTGGSDANVNFVLMYDGKHFSTGTQRGLIRGDGDPTKLTLERALGQSAQIGERDMGDPAELAAFIAWAKANYPAEHYALILSAHGDGWKSWGPDESSVKNGEGDFLYMGELSTALQGQHLDLIGFDSCLMASIEVADQVRTSADYLLASEELVPGYGFPYNTFSAALKQNPTWTGLDLGKSIVTLFAARYATLSSAWTLSLTDEQALPQLVNQVDTWSGLMRTGAGLFQGRDNPADNAQILMKFDRLASTQFGDANYVDLYDFAQRISNDGGLPDCVKPPIFQLLNLISGSVVKSQVHSAGLAAHGLHIHFPTNRKRTIEYFEDYDLPNTRATDGASHYAIYASNNDMLPLKAIDREDLSVLNPRTEWPEPPSPSLRFVTDTEWSRFLERFYHPVADNHILKGVSPAGEVLYPTTSAAACFNGADSISMPVGSTIYLSGVGSSDPDQEPFAAPPNAPAIPNLYLPSFYFWDLDSTMPCTANCNLQPQSVPPGAPAHSAVTNMDADHDLTNTNFDQKDASGPAASVVCGKEGTFNVTLMAWDDNHLKPIHDTIPDASYVHPQTDTHQSAITCTPAPPPVTTTTGSGVPLTAIIPVYLSVTNDPFDSASYVGLSQGTLTMTISGLSGNVRGGHLLPNTTSLPTISIKGDRPELVPATGTFNTATNSFDIKGTSTGPIAGFSNVDARYVLKLSGDKLDQISGTYEVGLNYTLNNEAEPVTYKLTGTLTQQTYPAASGPAISLIQTIYGGATISQNAFIEIHGTKIVPSTTPAEGVIWSNAPEFGSGKMPTQLGGVSVTVNGKPAFVEFFCSASTSQVCKSDQINVLTPVDTKTGPVSVVVTSGSVSTPPFTVTMKAASPSFLEFTGNGYVTAVHANYSLLGPEDLYAGYTKPANPGETIVLYATGFGLPAAEVTNGSATQSGTLPSKPICKLGTLDLPVVFAGVVSPGLAQLNVTVPAGAATSEISCTYNGAATPPGNLIAVQPH
jgi:uncharacterized protein (TIGR03437 family)